MTQHEELRALALAATSGPWRFNQKWADHIDAEDGDICMLTDNLFTGLTRPLIDRRNNASYIAAMSPDTTIALLDELDAARKALGVALGEKKALELSNHKLIDNSVDLHNEIDESTPRAKRYRYLRDRFYKDGGDLTICIPDAYDNFVGSSLSEGADAAIDAAIALIEGVKL